MTNNRNSTTVITPDQTLIEHVIAQNKELQQKHDAIKQELNELNGEKDMLENENEGMQKSRQVMVGYLKNFNEIVKLESARSKNNYELYVLYHRVHMVVLVGSVAFYGMFLAIDSPYLEMFYFAVFASCLAYFTQLTNSREIKLLSLNKELQTQLAKLEHANDLINDLIDNL